MYPATFEDHRFSPLEQLSMVLPIQCKHFWCSEYRKLIEIDDEIKQFYPFEYQLDTLNKVFLHDCDPILCNIDGILIKKAFKTFNLTEIERKLNEAGRLFQLENNITLQIS